MFNRGFRALAGLPDEVLRAKPHLRDIIISSQRRGILGVANQGLDEYVERRLTEVREAQTPPQEWNLPDGRTLQYEIVSLPDGGRLLTYFDLTHLKKVEAELRSAKEQAELRSQQLTYSLEDLRAAQDRLIQTEKLASLGQLTAGIAHEIKNPLNFVNNFSALSMELVAELREAIGAASLDGKLREEIAEMTGMLESNLDKVVQHGKRADSIVKNMLLHSRAGSGEHRPTDINAIVEESLNLAYHGARAERPGFNITLENDFDPKASWSDRPFPAGDHPCAAQPDLERLLCHDEARQRG
jgi:signal transduction histidine kinase